MSSARVLSARFLSAPFTLLLALLLPLTACAQQTPGADAPALVAGRDYIVIPNGKPFHPDGDKIEVIEVFGYTCGHCARFQPLVDAWKAKLADDVAFDYVPAAFGGYWIPYAKAYYAAQALSVADDTHAAMFDALHREHSLPIQGVTPEQLGQWYARKAGVDAQQFVDALLGGQVDDKIRRAGDFVSGLAVDGGPMLGTPMLIIDGKYRVLGRSHREALRIAGQLIARQRAARAE